MKQRFPNQATRTRSRLALIVTTVAALVAAVVLAAPARALTVDAQRATLYDPLRQVDMFKRTGSPERAAMGSVAKIMTMHVALRALKAGKVSLSDVVRISDKAAAQGCNCFPGSFDTKTLKGGEKMTLQDALYSVALSLGEPTVATAEFIANAVNHGIKDTGTTWTQSASLEQEFINMMNQRVSEIGLSNTHFMTVHGGDADGQYSTTDDLTRLFNFARYDTPAFITYLGFRTHTIKLTLPDGTVKWYPESKQYKYYPGIDADKNGGSDQCMHCLAAQATRLSRTLQVAVTQSHDEFTDAGNLFQYGFASLFRPVRTGDSGTQIGAAKEQSLDCSPSRAVHGIVSSSNYLGLTTWSYNAVGGSITRGKTTYLPTVHDYNQVAVADMTPYKGTFIPMLARRGDGTLQLVTWRLDSSGLPVVVDNITLPEQGTYLAIRPASATVFAIAYGLGPSQSRIQTWRLDANGHATAVASFLASGAGAGVALSDDAMGSQFGAATTAMLFAGATTSHETTLTPAFVDRSTGALTKGTVLTQSSTWSPQLTHQGYENFSLAGFDDSGRSIVRFYRIQPNKAAMQMGNTLYVAGTSAHDIVPVGPAQMTQAALTTVRDGNGNLKLTVWQGDDRASGSPATFSTLATAGAGAISDVQACGAGSTFSEGRYLTSVKQGDGTLKLIAWTVGEHQ